MNRAVIGLAAAGFLAVCRGGAATLCVEMETATNVVAPMVAVQRGAPPAGIHPVADASGDAYLEVPLGVGKPPKVTAGHATLEIDVPEAGAYYFWLRAYWEGECSNSIQVQVDDRPAFLIGEDATYRAWHWVKYPVSRLAAAPRLTKGRHTLVFIHREDGVRLDQLVLTTDARFVPVGIEQAGVRP